VEENVVTISWLPARLCESLALAKNTTLRVLITSGQHVSAFRRGAYELVRCSGPTENTEVSTCCAVRTGGQNTTIGKPITNSEVYIIGHDGGLLPVGITGELCVAGAGLARGYLLDEATTSNRFTSNPHTLGSRIYRTGDSARWLPDGRIELTGRVEEVSIDGHRVCLAEVERALESHRSIEEAVVMFDGGDPLHERLVAFIVLRGNLPAPPPLFVQELKLHLGQWLPGYMVPDTYMKVGMIPRDRDGRAQYECLRIPEERANNDEITTTQSATASKVTSIVEDLLDVQRVGTQANLVDLGMDSLITMSLLARINGAFGVAPSVSQVLTTPTISGVSHCVSEALCGDYRSFALMEQESRLL
jgi:tyrocidine synthetase-3